MSTLITRQESALTPQSAATRARLISTAERLFGSRGIEGVSLNDINVAAGQRNKNATHYHFGDKNGLLQAIIDKHLPGILLRRDQMIDEMETSGDITLSSMIRALLYPLAEKLFDGDGGRDFIRLNAQLSATHAAAVNHTRSDVFRIGPLDWLDEMRRQVMRDLPEVISQQRIALAVTMMLNGLADYSRTIEDAREVPVTDTEVFIRNLEDCLVAMLTAPVSAAADALQKRDSAPQETVAGNRQPRARRIRGR